MSLSELRTKDVINLPDGRLLGKVIDLEFCAQDGCVEAIVVPGPFHVGQILKGERTGLVIPWPLIEKIGDDVVLVNLPQEG
ncbi:MAG: YlmC/YmxH family sporulation protein [Oscillospiraceae bacterium]|nr:YlmC/YmxH family sporulation protein [Oscillospiraceae bacterium]